MYKYILQCNYVDVDVLKDEMLREGIKKFSDWPTIPQLYIDGEFVGGCDIMMELFKTKVCVIYHV
jgi:monothiol glutaredoxin